MGRRGGSPPSSRSELYPAVTLLDRLCSQSAFFPVVHHRDRLCVIRSTAIVRHEGLSRDLFSRLPDRSVVQKSTKGETTQRGDFPNSLNRFSESSSYGVRSSRGGESESGRWRRFCSVRLRTSLFARRSAEVCWVGSSSRFAPFPSVEVVATLFGG